MPSDVAERWELPDRARARRSACQAVDTLLQEMWAECCSRRDVPVGAALVAVGSHARYAAPRHSDLDLVLLVPDGSDPEAVERVAHDLWYPLWDLGRGLDHSVRTTGELARLVTHDLRVALGALDLRHLAGDETTSAAMRRQVRAWWRGQASHLLPRLADDTRQRWARVGDLAHMADPDLKNARGGLRDAQVLRALQLSWRIGVPGDEVVRLESVLLDVRGAVHEVRGRAGDRLWADDVPEVVSVLGRGSADELRDLVVSSARSLGHLTGVALREVDWQMRPRRDDSGRSPRLREVARGVSTHRGEMVLTRLVRHHLLLITASDADPDDRAATRDVAQTVRDVDTLELLHALTEADARATGPRMWTPWRARLVDGVVERTRAVLTRPARTAATS